MATRIAVRFPTRATLVALLAVGLVGCSAGGHYDGQIDSEGERTRLIFSQKPTWGLEDMVRRSDAVVIGELTRDLGDKKQPGDDPASPRFFFAFKDYELTIERAVYPGPDFPERIAVLLEEGVVSADGSSKAYRDENAEFNRNEQMLLFLENLAGPQFADGAGRPVPKGFTEKAYYQAILAGTYGKLAADGNKWRDSISGEAFTVGELEGVIRKQKAGSD